MKNKRVIPDLATANRVGYRHAATIPGATVNLFSYEQPRSRLTLFGVEVVTTDANGNRQTEIIVTQ